MADGIGQTRITIGRKQGVTQALKAMVEDKKMKLSGGSISKSEWNATVKVLDEIQANRKANNQTSIFGKGYLVHEGDNIDFTADEMAKIYKAMGVEVSEKPEQPAAVKPEQAASEPPEQPAAAKPEPPVTATSAQPAQAPKNELQEQFNNDSKKTKLGAAIPTSDTLKENGFGFHPEPTVHNFGGQQHQVDAYGYKDENGLHYSLDKNGGKTYVDKEGNSIRVSEFESQFAFPGSTMVSYTKKGGNFKDEVIYGADGKAIQGKTTVIKEDGTTISYEYKYDSNGNKVVQNNNSQPAQLNITPKPLKEPSITSSMHLAFLSDRYADKNGADLRPDVSVVDFEAIKNGGDAPRKFNNCKQSVKVNDDGSKSFTYMYKDAGGRVYTDYRTVIENPDGSLKVTTSIECENGQYSDKSTTYKKEPMGLVRVSHDIGNDGYIDSETIRTSDGKQIALIEYGYNKEKGLKTTEIELSHKDGSSTSIKSNTVNEKEVLREVHHMEDGHQTSFAQYGENNQLISRSETSYYPSGTFEGLEGKFEKEELIYDKNNKLETKIEYSYEKDKDGYYVKITKETNFQTGEVKTYRSDETSLHLNMTLD